MEEQKRKSNPKRRKIVVVSTLITMCVAAICISALATNNFAIMLTEKETEYGMKIEVSRSFFGFGNTLILKTENGVIKKYNIKKELGNDFSIEGLSFKNEENAD